ncbi:MAG TPA: hypothetical protein VGK59_17630 [Ohtaekwangia sp.]
MRLTICLVAFLFLAQSNAKGQKLELRTGDKNFGWHFIIWTTDTAKCSLTRKAPITFDQNNVAYVHTAFQNQQGIKIVNEKTEDISGQMREIMKSAYSVRFYRPTDEEIKNHPSFDEYFMRLSDKAANIYLDLEKKGYIIRDPKIE